MPFTDEAIDRLRSLDEATRSQVLTKLGDSDKQDLIQSIKAYDERKAQQTKGREFWTSMTGTEVAEEQPYVYGAPEGRPEPSEKYAQAELPIRSIRPPAFGGPLHPAMAGQEQQGESLALGAKSMVQDVVHGTASTFAKATKLQARLNAAMGLGIGKLVGSKEMQKRTEERYQAAAQVADDIIRGQEIAREWEDKHYIQPTSAGTKFAGDVLGGIGAGFAKATTVGAAAPAMFTAEAFFNRTEDALQAGKSPAKALGAGVTSAALNAFLMRTPAKEKLATDLVEVLKVATKRGTFEGIVQGAGEIGIDKWILGDDITKEQASERMAHSLATMLGFQLAGAASKAKVIDKAKSMASAFASAKEGIDTVTPALVDILNVKKQMVEQGADKAPETRGLFEELSQEEVRLREATQALVYADKAGMKFKGKAEEEVAAAPGRRKGFITRGVKDASQKQSPVEMGEQPIGQEGIRPEGAEGMEPVKQGLEAPRAEAAKEEVTDRRHEALPIPEEHRVAERRRDEATRKRVAEMTPEEMTRALLVSDKTGLGNLRAWKEVQEDAPRRYKASIDVDSLKWVNDNLGHGAGDALLGIVGEAFRETGAMEDVFHVSGDEFLAHGDTPEIIGEKMQKAYDYLKANPVEIELASGERVKVTGGFSYGVGENLDVAETGLKSEKARREATGERAARGEEPPGVVRVQPGLQGDLDQGAVLPEPQAEVAQKPEDLVRQAYPGDENKEIRKQIYREGSFRGFDTPEQVKDLYEQRLKAHAETVDDFMSAFTAGESVKIDTLAPPPEVIAGGGPEAAGGVSKVTSVGIAAEVVNTGVTSRAKEITTGLSNIAKGFVTAVTDPIKSLQAIRAQGKSNEGLEQVGEFFKKNDMIQEEYIPGSETLHLAKSKILSDMELPKLRKPTVLGEEPSSDVRSSQAMQGILSPTRIEDQAIDASRGFTVDRFLQVAHEASVKANGTRFYTDVLSRAGIPNRQVEIAKRVRPFTDIVEKTLDKLRPLAEKREAIQRALDEATDPKGIATLKKRLMKFDGGIEGNQLRLQKAKYKAALDGCKKEIMSMAADPDFGDLRVALLIGKDLFTDPDTVPDWLQPHLRPEEGHVAEVLDNFLSKEAKPALEWVNISADVENYFPRLILRSFKNKTPEARERVYKDLAFHERTPGAFNMFPSVYAGMDYYIDTLADKISKQPLLDKWSKGIEGPGSYSDPLSENYAPQYASFLKQTMLEMQNPPPRQWWESTVRGLKTYYAAKQIWGSITVMRKHSPKVIDILAQHHVGAIPGTIDTAKILSSEAVRYVTKALGFKADDAKASTKVMMDLMMIQKLNGVLYEDPQLARVADDYDAFSTRSLETKRKASEVWNKIGKVGGFPTSLVEFLMRGVNVVTSVEVGARAGLDPIQNYKNALLQAAQIDYMTGPDTPGYLKTKFGKLTMYTMQPFKKIELLRGMVAKAWRGEKSAYGDDSAGRLIRALVIVGAVHAAGAAVAKYYSDMEDEDKGTMDKAAEGLSHWNVAADWVHPPGVAPGGWTALGNYGSWMFNKMSGDEPAARKSLQKAMGARKILSVSPLTAIGEDIDNIAVLGPGASAKDSAFYKHAMAVMYGWHPQGYDSAWDYLVGNLKDSNRSEMLKRRAGRRIERGIIKRDRRRKLP